MYDFIEYVFWELQNSLVLAVLAAAGAVAVLMIAYFIHKRKYRGSKKFPWGKALLYLVFAGYGAVVFYATILRGTGGYRDWNLHLFRAWREAWNNFTPKNWANVLLNVAMFVPLGFLLPLLGKPFRKWFIAIPTGFGASLAIELLQLILIRGVWDVDDLFANTLGAAIGYFASMALLSLFGQKGRRLVPGLVYGGLLAVFVLGICGIFFVYEWKEYGNLPMAAAYTNNTQGVEWTVACDLPEVSEKMPVYRTQSRSIGECDAFAREFKTVIGTEYTTVSYYQEAAYYMDQAGDENGTHFLFVSYLDPGYTYSFGFMDDPVWAETDRQTLENALKKFPVMIPNYAQFTPEGDGWYRFSVDQHIDGAVMVDGTLRCRFATDGTIREIENHLLSYTYHDTVSVISPEEACRRMQAGKFYDEGFFENKAPGDVTILGCVLSYCVDTKGFYQPVYYFDVASRDGNYRDRIMIPAMQ